MKKKILVFFLCLVILLSSVCIVSALTKEKIRVSDLASQADYVIIASTYRTICGIEPIEEKTQNIRKYEKDGKYYTEVYVDCPVSDSIGEVVTIVNNENYFEEDGTFVLFLNKVKNKEGTYTTLNEKTGIIKLENGKAKSLDKKVEISSTDLLWDWAYLKGEEKQKEILTSDGFYYFTYSTNIYEAAETTSAP